MNFGLHGNYCGPNWTDGQNKPAEEGRFDIESIDELDEICKDHDKQYQKGNYLNADREFVSRIRHAPNSLKAKFFGLAINQQRLLREIGIMEKQSKRIQNTGNPSTKKAAAKAIKGGISKPQTAKSISPRKVAALKALIQHHKPSKERNMVGVATALSGGFTEPRTAIVIGGKKKKKKNLSGTSSVTISGDQYLGNVTIAAGGQNVGDNLFTQNISPSTMSNGRLAAFAQLFEKYEFTKVRIHYITQVSTTQPGQLVMFYDYDPTDTQLSGVQAVYQATSSASSAMFQVWDQKSLTMSRGLKQPAMFTSQGNDPRLNTQAVFRLLSNSLFPPGELTLGSLFVEYTIRFYGAEIQPDVSAVSIPLQHYESDWANYDPTPVYSGSVGLLGDWHRPSTGDIFNMAIDVVGGPGVYAAFYTFNQNNVGSAQPPKPYFGNNGTNPQVIKNEAAFALTVVSGSVCNYVVSGEMIYNVVSESNGLQPQVVFKAPFWFSNCTCVLDLTVIKLAADYQSYVEKYVYPLDPGATDKTVALPKPKTETEIAIENLKMEIQNLSLQILPPIVASSSKGTTIDNNNTSSVVGANRQNPLSPQVVGKQF